MYNWSVDEEKFKKADPEGYKIWQLEQAINYGKAGEKLNEKLVKGYWPSIKNNLDPFYREFLELLLWPKKEKKYSFEELLMQAKAKFDWDISLIELGARFVEGSKMTDFPRMVREIDHREWQDFFLNEAKKLKKDIFE